MKFEHLGGGSHHEGKKEYNKGDVFESSLNLTVVFPGKFRKLSAEEAAPIAEKPSPAPAKVPAASDKESPGKAKDKPSKKAEKKAAILAARGQDVTKSFPLAHEEGFTVFKRGELFHVFEGDDTAPLKGGEGLKQAQVDSFVKTYLEE